MKNFVQPGHSLAWTNTTGQLVLSGAVVVVGILIGIASSDIADGATGVLNLDGVFELKKKTGFTVAPGDALYWNDTDGITKTTTDKPIGGGFSTQVSGDVVVSVKLYGPERQALYQAASTASDVAGLKTDFNALLTKLINAGLLASS